MVITFLGTGTSQGVPVIGCTCQVCQSLDFRDKRLRTSLHLQVEGKSLVFDTGPDFRQQMLRQRIHQLDAVIFTHEHKDHTAGLDDVRAYNFRQKKDMPIYGHPRVIKQLKQEFAYAFATHRYPGVPLLEVHEIGNEPFSIDGTTLLPIEVFHYQLPVLGFRIGDFTYITDANSIADAEKEKIKGSKVLVLNALQQQSHISHFNLQEATALAEELGAEQTYFTHISHRMGLHQEVNPQLPPGISLAYDGLSITL
ncbi:MAG: MBL fold metallo-hydrolase [Bacteroidetes bacterium]|nr:MBL fold metallo-hydrolase [Bacteroidota bacterium]